MKRIQEHVKRAGYQVACATSAKSASVTDDPWALRRVKVKGSDKLGDFKRKGLIGTLPIVRGGNDEPKLIGSRY